MNWKRFILVNWLCYMMLPTIILAISVAYGIKSLAQSRPSPEATALHMISPQPHKTMYRDVLVTFRLKVAGTDLETLRKNAQFAADRMASHAPYGTEVESVIVEDK